MLCFGILCVYGTIGFLDTLHFRLTSPENPTGGNIQSVLDRVCQPLVQRTEKTYSAPFATHLYTKETILTADGRHLRVYPRLQHAGTHLQDPHDAWPGYSVINRGFKRQDSDVNIGRADLRAACMGAKEIDAHRIACQTFQHNPPHLIKVRHRSFRDSRIHSRLTPR